MLHGSTTSWVNTQVTGASRGSDENWSDELWAILVGSVDATLRYCYGIYEFTDNPDCVLRINLSDAREPVTLTDGTAIEIGDPIGSLHFWNEHLPRYSDFGPGLSWASEMRRRVALSMRALADHVDANSAWNGVHAFMAHAAFSSRIGIVQLDRVMRRLGFEWVPGRRATLAALADAITGYGLARVHNPAALARQPLFRRRHEIWISRSALFDRYGRGASAEGVSPLGAAH